MDQMINGLVPLFQWPAPLFLLLGVFLGMTFGILPGLGGPQVLALLIPLTFGMDEHLAVILLMGAMGAVPFGGSVTAILINTPGTGQNAATCFDGYPLTRQGKAGMALAASATASGMGALFGVVILLLLVPVARKVVLAFSYPEFFMLAVMGISMIAAVAQGSMWRALISGGLGLLFSTVGYDPITGNTRFTFGIEYLWDGIDLVPVLIGLFAISEVGELLYKKGSISLEPVKMGWAGIWEGVKSVFKNFGLFVRCSVIGTIIGIIPGVGGAVANFLAYSHAVQTAKDQKLFGQGDVRGVIAPQSADNAKDGGALVPTVAFGIPGSIETAVLLSALVLHGLEPGPKLLIFNADVLYTLIFALVGANLVASTLGLAASLWMVPLTRVSATLVAPVVLAVALMGAYATKGMFGDVVLAIAFGVLGYAMKRYGYSRVPMIIALVLGEMAQQSFHQTLISMGVTGFFSRPISLALFLITVASLGFPLIRNRWKRGGARYEA